MKTNPYLGILIEERRVPQDYIIRKESEPLLSQGFAFRVYQVDGTPLYIGMPSLEGAESRLKSGYPVKSIRYEIDKIYERGI